METCTRCGAEAALTVSAVADEKTAERLCLGCAGKRLGEADTNWAAQIGRLTAERLMLEDDGRRITDQIKALQEQIDKLKAGGKALPAPRPTPAPASAAKPATP